MPLFLQANRWRMSPLKLIHRHLLAQLLLDRPLDRGSEPNSPASAQLSETMMLSPAAEKVWALETTVASVAENLDGNLQPSQRGVCGS